MRIALFAFFLFPGLVIAACPKTKKEWQKIGPKFLVETAARKTTKVDIPDFSAKLGKSAVGAATPFKQKKKDFVLIEARMPSDSLFLSGVMKCDELTKQPVLLSLSWVKGDQSGLVKLEQ
jgi:hypothetical protein